MKETYLESRGVVLISAIRILLNCKHFLVISQSPQPPAHRAYAPAGRSPGFLIFPCVRWALREIYLPKL